MSQVGPTDLPYRHRVSPLRAYMRFLGTLTIAIVVTLILYRESFRKISQIWSEAHIDILTLERLQEILSEFAPLLYADDVIVVDFVELLTNVVTTPFVAVPLISCGAITLALILARRLP